MKPKINLEIETFGKHQIGFKLIPKNSAGIKVIKAIMKQLPRFDSKERASAGYLVNTAGETVIYTSLFSK